MSFMLFVGSLFFGSTDGVSSRSEPDMAEMNEIHEVDFRLEEYYRRVAREYDKLYERDDPVRKNEILTTAKELKQALKDRCVLEVACGTGFWTRIATEVARHVVATDKLEEMLSIAREKCKKLGNVELHQADAYELGSIPRTFDAGLVGFWLSHVPRARVDEFLDGFHTRLGSRAVVFMIDSVYAPGLGGELVSLPHLDDTFKRRTLPDGSTHLVLKNYYDPGQIRAILGDRSEGLRIEFGACYWRARYKVR